MKKLAAVSILVTLVLSSLAYAHSGATGVVKQRMDMMGDVANAMKTIGEMLKGKVDFNSKSARSAALAIEKHALGFPELFPKDSTAKPSEALPVIWKNWDEFTELFNEMKTQSKKLAELSAISTQTDDIKAQFGLVGKTCKSCHEKFRLKK